MDLDAARALKLRIRSAARAGKRPPFATGITRGASGDYRVAILLRSPRDRRLLPAIVKREGHAIDIEVVGVLRAASSTNGVEPSNAPVLRIGASVGHVRGGGGSLGFFAARRRDGRIGLVSCNHVIAMADRGSDGDGVVSPSALDGSPRVVASLDGSYPRFSSPGGAVDCAFAALHDGVAYDAASVAGGTLTRSIADAAPGLEVTKVGRITDARPGVVLKVEVDDVALDFGLRRYAFDGVTVIGAATPQPFCDGGDSGALVYTRATLEPLGLLFATSRLGGPYGVGQTWIHPMSRVAEALQVDLVTA